MALAYDPGSEADVYGRGARRRVRTAVGGTRGTESFEGRTNRRRAPDRLSHQDLEELEALWGLRDSAAGVRSSHGAVQARLLRAPPRDDLRKTVIAELERAGGRMPEGTLHRIVVAEQGTGTAYEVRRAITMLTNAGKLERVPVEQPKGTKADAEEKATPPRGDGSGIETLRMLLPVDRLTVAQRGWTGYDLRLVRAEEKVGKPRKRGDVEMVPEAFGSLRSKELHVVTAEEEAADLVTMRLALRSTKTRQDSKQDLWRRQDLALEREHHTLYVSDDSGGYSNVEHDDNLSSKQRAGIERATSTLARLSERHRLVIRSYYFEAKDSLHHVGEHTIHAEKAMAEHKASTAATVIRWLAKDAEWTAQLLAQAEELVGEASVAYRDARRAVSRG